MKPAWNRIIVPILIAMLPVFGKAQSRPQGNFRLGFTASPTFGRITFDDNSAYRSGGTKVGYSYGVIGDFGFTDNYYFGSGFLLTTMSGDADIRTSATTTEQIGYKIQYIEIPLTLKLKTGDEGLSGRFYGQFGPDLGVKVSDKHDFTASNIKDNAEIIRVGLLIGAGAEWKLKQSSVLTGISYNNPVTKLFTNPRAKNYVVTLNLGVFF